MSVRKLAMVVLMFAGLSFCLTPPAPAVSCPTGATCSLGQVSACETYCDKRGLIFDYCNTTTHCCICITA